MAKKGVLEEAAGQQMPDEVGDLVRSSRPSVQLRPGLLGKEATPFSAPLTTGPGVLRLQ